MTDQETLDMLAENECKLFYAYCANPTDEAKAAHQAAKIALESFADSIGIVRHNPTLDATEMPDAYAN